MSVDCPCPKELEVQKKDYSPCIVADNELVVYVIIDPLQYKEGRLSNAAFSKSKLREGTLSVSRAAYTSVAMLRQCVVEPQIKKDSQRRLIGAMRAICADIRAITEEDSHIRAVCVIDDGNENDPAHAHLSFSEPAKNWSRNVQMAVRGNLILAFGEFPVSLEEALLLEPH